MKDLNQIKPLDRDQTEDLSWDYEEEYYSDIRPNRQKDSDSAVATTGNVKSDKDLEGEIIDNDY